MRRVQYTAAEDRVLMKAYVRKQRLILAVPMAMFPRMALNVYST